MIASPKRLAMKPSKNSFRVIRGNRTCYLQREVFHVSLFEGPPPDSVVAVYAAYGSSYSSDFTFAPVGLPGTAQVQAFASRAVAEVFVSDVFPGVPCSFVPWVAFQMIAAIGEGV